MRNELGEAVHEAMATREIPAELVLAFAPLHKRALGIAVGTVFGGLIFVLTVIGTIAPQGREQLGLLGQYFAGYTVSWGGAFVGLAWGWFVGFVMGWFTAYTRNFVLAAQIWLARAKQELGATRDFLDHI
jgi:hypothetical protein